MDIINTKVNYSSSSLSDKESLFRGNGHTKSCASCGINSWIFSYKYYCLFSDRPSGTSALGRSDGDGRHDMSLRSLIFFSSVTSHDLQAYTVPGCADENLKWEKDLIPFIADLITQFSKKVAQSCDATITLPV